MGTRRIKQNFLTIAIFLSSVCTTQAQKLTKEEAFTLSGKLIGRDTGYIILLYPNILGKWIKDTSNLKNGMFEFSGEISEPSFVTITVYPEKGNYAQIFLEKGHQTINLKKNNFHVAKMNGSYTQKQFDSLNEKLSSVKLKYKRLYSNYDSANKEFINQKDTILKNLTEQETEKLFKQLQKPISEMRNIKIKFIAQHPDSYVSPTELYSVINHLSISSVELLFNAFTQRIKESRIGNLCLTTITKKKKNQIGDATLDFNVRDINGQNISMSQFRGKYLVLDFWASWCIPCRQNSVNLIKLYRQYHKKGLEIIGISDDTDSLIWRKTIEKEGIGIWHNTLSIKKDENDRINNTKKISQIYDVNFLPTNILIDTTGVIIGRFGLAQEGDDESINVTLKKIFK